MCFDTTHQNGGPKTCSFIALVLPDTAYRKEVEYMSFSNSFHSSSRDHSISNVAKLAKVQAHNSRNYFSLERDKNKTYSLIGDTNQLEDDVKEYINKKFNQEIEAYNARQKRKDRKINKDAFNYFNDNKATDIANEVIFQIADKEFWDQFRQDIVVRRNDKEYVQHRYPAKIEEVMNDIYKKQAEAYERIYETHSDIILNRIQEAYNEAHVAIDSIQKNAQWKYYQIILRAEKQPKFKREEYREKCISEFTEIEKEEFAVFFSSRETIRAIEDSRLIERIASGELQIKLINLAGHGDEKSYHAHGVSVCSAGGYKQGLSCRIAKSIVLNRWALEVIQDRMREIAQEEIDKHPEIFGEKQLDQKGIGRNMDYTTEQHIRMQQEKLLARGEKLQEATKEATEEYDQILNRVSNLKKERGNVRHEIEKLKEEKEAIQVELSEIIQEKNNKKAEYHEKIAQWDYDIALMENEQEYIAAAEASQDTIEHLSGLCDSLLNRKSPLRDRSIEKAFVDAFRGFYEALSESLKKLRKYEAFNALPEEQCYSIPLTEAKDTLDNQIKLTSKTRQSITYEHDQQKKPVRNTDFDYR